MLKEKELSLPSTNKTMKEKITIQRQHDSIQFHVNFLGRIILSAFSFIKFYVCMLLLLYCEQYFSSFILLQFFSTSTKTTFVSSFVSSKVFAFLLFLVSGCRRILFQKHKVVVVYCSAGFFVLAHKYSFCMVSRLLFHTNTCSVHMSLLPQFR